MAANNPAETPEGGIKGEVEPEGCAGAACVGPSGGMGEVDDPATEAEADLSDGEMAAGSSGVQPANHMKGKSRRNPR
jgi:hypothetical protein